MVSLVVQSYRAAHVCADLIIIICVYGGGDCPAAPLVNGVYETMVERQTTTTTSIAIHRHDGPFVDRALHMIVENTNEPLAKIFRGAGGRGRKRVTTKKKMLKKTS